MTYAVIDNQNVSTHASRSEALDVFVELARRRAGIQVFAVCASGAYRNITPVLAHSEQRAGA